METSDRLRQQINQLSNSTGASPELQKKVKMLENQLEQAKRQAASSGGGSSTVDSLQLKNEMRKMNAENQELKKQLEEFSSGASAGPMATVRLQREIATLKSQMEMLKKDKEQMQKKYEDLMRKQEFDFDEGW